MYFALLLAAQVAGLLVIPLGLPGLWVQVAALGAYAWATGFEHVGWPTLIVALLTAAAAEVLELVMGGRYTARYGGSRRAAWGAILGGLIGAVVGVPILLIGSVIGAFIGAFVGATVMELSRSRDGEWRGAVRVGYGALIGRLAGSAL